MLEANLDDLNPQVFGYVLDRLLAEGALDVFATAGADEEEPSGNAADGSGQTAGCRQTDADHFRGDHHAGRAAARGEAAGAGARLADVVTQWGEVRMKIAGMNGTVTNYAPEYEDCREIASSSTCR